MGVVSKCGSLHSLKSGGVGVRGGRCNGNMMGISGAHGRGGGISIYMCVYEGIPAGAVKQADRWRKGLN